jgi:hypothetical protein
MEAVKIKKELHEYIEEADDRLLLLIYGMVLADKQATLIPEWHLQIVEERLQEYNKSPENLIKWDTLKAGIEKMK